MCEFKWLNVAKDNNVCGQIFCINCSNINYKNICLKLHVTLGWGKMLRSCNLNFFYEWIFYPIQFYTFKEQYQWYSPHPHELTSPHINQWKLQPWIKFCPNFKKLSANLLPETHVLGDQNIHYYETEELGTVIRHVTLGTKPEYLTFCPLF